MRFLPAFALALCLPLAGCMHELQILNLRDYQVATAVGDPGIRPRVALHPFKGDAEGSFYYFAVKQQMQYDAYIDLVELDANPDKVVTIEPVVRYTSSAMNFPIMFPGFLVFTPAWNGYVYHADIDTRIEVHDGKGAPIGEENLHVRYDIRQADVNRTAFANFGLFIVTSPIPLVAGIYDAVVFDDYIIGAVQAHVRENYGRYVYRHIVTKTAPHAR